MKKENAEIMTINRLICTFVALFLAKECLADNIQYLPRLMSDSSCDDKRCPAPINIDLYQRRCKYHCPPHHRFVCLEDDKENVIEFCMPDNLECEPGFKVNVSIDGSNTSRVQLYKLPCPSGTYQQYTSNCLDACVKQDPASFLPDGFKTFEPGNTIEPMKVACDDEKGYFSSTNRTWYYYDNNFSHQYWNYCDKIENNICPDGQRLLKNGSCVCGFGHWSDDEKKCVPNVDSTDKSLQSTKKSTDTEPSSDVTSQSDNSVMWIIVIMLAIVIGIMLVVAIFFYRKKYCITKNKQITRNKYMFYEKVTVNSGNEVTINKTKNMQNESEDEE